MIDEPDGQETKAEGVTQSRQLRGDLDWITLRALERDRARRYGSVSDLAADLQRHLQNVPVLASPPGTMYRAGKFVRRHRVGVALAGVFVALLVAFATSTAIQAGRIARERDRANLEAGVANAVNDFLKNDLLAQAGASAQARPDTKPDPDLKVRTALDRAAAGIESRFETQPLVEASIRTTIGKTYEDLGLYPEAEPHLMRALELTRRELGERDVRYLSSVSDVAGLHLKEAKYEQADRLLTGSLEIARRVLGNEHPQTLTLMTGLGQIYTMQGSIRKQSPSTFKRSKPGAVCSEMSTPKRWRPWAPWRVSIGARGNMRRLSRFGRRSCGSNAACSARSIRRH
jgi:eukaryotic-like serine/threonine-protein kinase